MALDDGDQTSGGGAAPAAPPPPPAGTDRVPLDQRVLGFDRRTILPGLFALAVWAIWGYGVPWVDDQVEYDDPIEAGDLIDLGGGELTFEPSVGWDLTAGVRVDDANVTPTGSTAQAAVADETAVVVATRSTWDGTAEELLDRTIDISDDLDRLVIDDERQRIDITSVDGIEGRLAYFVGVDEQGVIAAYVLQIEPDEDGGDAVSVGVTFEAFGPNDAIQDSGTEIGQMIGSLTYTPSEEEQP